MRRQRRRRHRRRHQGCANSRRRSDSKVRAASRREASPCPYSNPVASKFNHPQSMSTLRVRLDRCSSSEMMKLDERTQMCRTRSATKSKAWWVSAAATTRRLAAADLEQRSRHRRRRRRPLGTAPSRAGGEWACGGTGASGSDWSRCATNFSHAVCAACLGRIGASNYASHSDQRRTAHRHARIGPSRKHSCSGRRPRVDGSSSPPEPMSWLPGTQRIGSATPRTN